ncbi:MAG: radical SAM protein [Elusimicrobia bacterium]|nr:radical SAM protein [Elusimicrobiota bacterium]
MKKAGVFKVAFAVETGNKAILREIKKQLDLDKALEASHLARKHGMIVIGFFMIGLPGDTETTLQETIDFAIKMNPHMANFSMTIPFYGTELYRKIEKEGKFLFDTKEGISYGFYAVKAYYELGHLTEDLMVKYYKKAYREFYFRFSKVIDVLCSIRSFGEFQWFFNTTLNTLFPKLNNFLIFKKLKSFFRHKISGF